MTALSELLHRSVIAPARAIERIEKSDEHAMNRATIYRYVEGDHPERPKEKYLQALAYGFELPVTQVREAAAAAPGELDLWEPPLESGQLTQPVRDALDVLIKALAKEGTQRAASAAQKTDEVGQRRIGKPSRIVEEAARPSTDPKK